MTKTFLAFLLLSCWAEMAFAQSTPEQDLETIQQDIGVSEQRQKELAADAEAAVKAQDELAQKLIGLATTAAAQEQQLAESQDAAEKLKGDIAAVNLSLASQQDEIALVLAALQRLEQNPPPALAVSPNDVLEGLRGAMIMGAIVPELRQTARKLHDQLTLLKDLRAKLDRETTASEEALTLLEVSRGDIEKLIEDKKVLADTSTQQLVDEKRRAEALAEKATSLQQLLKQLAEERAKEEQRLSAEAKAKEAARLKAEEERMAALRIPLAQAKGQLNYPAQGRIVRLFGEDNGVGARVDGIVIATNKTAQVTSPVAGKVEFAGKFKSYGQMVILNAGDDYLVLLAGMEAISAQNGQFLLAGEPVGAMGDRAGPLAVSNGLTDLTNPVLYIEFRKNGDPVDPSPWWTGKQKEAMR
jgi:septal ring factor EnvC (AmiA/AmiB activator)